MGRKSAVAVSPYAEEIHELLQSGWSPAAVWRHLVARYGEGPDVPSRASLERYRLRHVLPVAVVPVSLVRQAIRGLRYRVDTLKVMDELIWAQEQRIALGWQREQEAGTLDVRVDKALGSCFEYLQARHRIAVELGIERELDSSHRVVPAQGRVVPGTGGGDHLVDMPEPDFRQLYTIIQRQRAQAAVQPHGRAPGPAVTHPGSPASVLPAGAAVQETAESNATVP